ncbi:MAG: IS21 family transposase [Bacteroidales bacterium]|nr:IS21 family transposase [Bacteroidales bacterium]
MWYKVQELTAQGLNKSQIRVETGLDRATIKKYQQMDEEAFHGWIQHKTHLPQKLKAYQQQVRQMLAQAPYLSSAQVEDRLKEANDDLPQVHSKTVYNFVQSIRQEYGISKPVKAPRIFIKLQDPPYGQQAQVDFGETWMQDKAGRRHKVHFFTMVLSRSRYKFVYFQKQSFTAVTAVMAHYLAFEYFGGVPHEILYDQDNVFIHDENLGDYLLTGAFNTFCNEQGFQPVFCRKADPQSKGKVENVVKYVKQNFTRGREFVNIEVLNQQAIAWLDRTANAKEHSATRLIPKSEWEIEKAHLLPFKSKQLEEAFSSYKVRKDHTICYKSNYYSLPTGTYQGPESCVLLKATQNELHVYALDKTTLICIHQISNEQGKTIWKTDHGREKSKTINDFHQQVLERLGDNALAQDYLQQFKSHKSRYYRDNLQYIIKNYRGYTEEVITDALHMCMENQIYNGKDLINLMDKKQQEQTLSPPGISKKEQPDSDLTIFDTSVSKSDIHTYEKFF